MKIPYKRYQVDLVELEIELNMKGTYALEFIIF